MIVTIVDSAGKQIYRGNERNPKVARLVAAGNVVVRAEAPDENATWNGTAWVAGSPPVPDPTATDLTPEDIERLLVQVPGITAAKIAQAKRDRGKPLP